MPVNIGQVAELAGVSEATVSRVLNGFAGVRPETRRRVEEAVRQLNFAPNPVAQGLRAGRTTMIGVVVPDVADPFFPSILKGIENTLAQHDYRVMIGDCQNRPETERQSVDWLVRSRVDGLILLAPLMDDASILSLADSGSLLALFGRQVVHPRISSVTVDNVLAGRTAVGHLIQHGHRSVAIVTGPPNAKPDVVLRLEGYRQALEEAGISYDPALVVHGDLLESGGAQALRSLMAGARRPTAVFCINDETALGVVHAAGELGLTVPGDLAVIGFDNTRLARLATPPLTTVNQPTLDIGAWLATNMLERLAAERPKAQRITLPFDLVIRHSCGC